MATYLRNKINIPFRLATVVAAFSSIIFITLGATRFFQIDFFLNLLPEITREVLDESPIWVYYGYLITVSANLYAVVLLYKRDLRSITISKYSAAGMIVLITHHFFITEFIHLYEAIEMLFTLIFYCLLYTSDAADE